MTLYFNINTHEIKDINSSLINEWIAQNNPKINDWKTLPEKPSENAIWNNGSWTIPSNTIPQSISARQVRLWLIRNGISLQNVTDAINSIEDPILRDSVSVEWEYAPYIERSHPMLVPLAQSLGLSESDIDRAFNEAVNI